MLPTMTLCSSPDPLVLAVLVKQVHHTSCLLSTYLLLKSFVNLSLYQIFIETDVLVQNCVQLVTAHQSLCSAEGLRSLPKIASEVEQHSEQLTHAISSTTDR